MNPIAKIGEPFEPYVSPAVAEVQPDDRLFHERIEARAYELFLARGGGEGRALDDWLRAEEEVLGAREGRLGR
jgi:hypothetical protein